MNRYIVMAYRRNSSSYSRGCEMDRFSSDYQWAAFDNPEETIEWMAEKKAYPSKWGESDYEVTLLIDGDTWTEDMEYDTIEIAADERAKTILRDKAIIKRLSA